MYCLDTNIVVDFLHGDASITACIARCKDVGESLVITPITLCELYKGAHLFFDTAQEVANIDAFISTCFSLDFSTEACKEFGRMYAHLKKKGALIEEMDIMIAAIAKIHGAIVVTRNKKHFDKLNVRVEEW